MRLGLTQGLGDKAHFRRAVTASDGYHGWNSNLVDDASHQPNMDMVHGMDANMHSQTCDCEQSRDQEVAKIHSGRC